VEDVDLSLDLVFDSLDVGDLAVVELLGTVEESQD